LKKALSEFGWKLGCMAVIRSGYASFDEVRVNVLAATSIQQMPLE
jgi:hypothetical protein